MNHEIIDDNKPLRFTATEEKNATTEEVKKFFAKRFYLRGDIKIGEGRGWDCKEVFEQVGFDEAEAMNLTQGIQMEKGTFGEQDKFHSTYSRDLWEKFKNMEVEDKNIYTLHSNTS